MSDQIYTNVRTQLLQGQVALITGASKGIGAATARLFAQHGAAVGVNYHTNSAKAQEVVDAIRSIGGRAITVQASVDDARQIEAMVQRVERELGPIDTLVMNALVERKSADDSVMDAMESASILPSFLESSWESYQQEVMRFLAGVYLPAHIVAPLMVERKRGNLIAISSLAARLAYPQLGVLAACKGSVDALMRVLASELGPHGIRANVVAPGAVAKEAADALLQDVQQTLSDGVPLRRMASPEDIAGAILLLATDEARYLTGNYLAAGGGSYMAA